MNKITLYGLNSFDRSVKARWLLTEMGMEFQDHWLDNEKGELESESYLRIHPLGRVPAITIGNQPLFESSAICAYLADQHLDKNMAPPLSSPERADYQQWMYFAASTLDPIAIRISIIEDIPPGEVADKKMSGLMTDVKETYAFLNQVLGKKEYLVANRFGAADICVSYHLYVASLWPELKEVMDQLPHLSSYMKRMQERPSALKAKAFSYEG